MWELNNKKGWGMKNWCLRTVVLEKTLESPLDCKEIKPVHPKGNQSWIFIGRIDAEAETLILWPPDAKSQLIRKDPDCGKNGRQEENVTTEKKMAGWHHQLNGHEYEQEPWDSKGQRTWHAAVHRVTELDMTSWLNNNNLYRERDVVPMQVLKFLSLQT